MKEKEEELLKSLLVVVVVVPAILSSFLAANGVEKEEEKKCLFGFAFLSREGSEGRERVLCLGEEANEEKKDEDEEIVGRKCRRQRREFSPWSLLLLFF